MTKRQTNECQRLLANASRVAADRPFTAEGALGQVTTHLQRIRELTVQAGNGTLSPTDHAAIQAEIDQRLDEIDRIGLQTGFTGVSVVGENRRVHIQVGANDGETIGIGLQAINWHPPGVFFFASRPVT